MSRLAVSIDKSVVVSAKVRSVIASCVALDHLSIAELYAERAVAFCRAGGAPVTFDFSGALSARRTLIERGLV